MPAVSNYTVLTYIPAAIYDILSDIKVVYDISLLRQVIGL